MRKGASESVKRWVVENGGSVPDDLDPMALRGVKFRPSNAQQILRRNIMIYGVGGIIAPFIFIKLIDLILTALGAY